MPPIIVPERESRDAYVRRADGVVYICPWQTRLRSWLALDELTEILPAGLTDAFMPRAVAERAVEDFEEWKRANTVLRPHIRTSTWHVPLAWFTGFDAAERRLVLGDATDGDTGREMPGHATAAPARTLVYVTAMAQSRRRLARALAVVRRSIGDGEVVSEVERVARWLEEFHPHSVVELDYGGLVNLLDDEALQGDQSVAEVAAALTGLETGESELATAMYKRVVARWRTVQALESAN